MISPSLIVPSLAIFGFLGGFATLFGGSSDNNSTTSSYQLVWVLVYGLMFFFALVSNIRFSNILRSELIIYIIPGIFILSSFWSFDIGSSLRYSMSAAFTVFGAVLFHRVCLAEKVNAFELLVHIGFFFSVSGLVLAILGFEFAFYQDPLARSGILEAPLVKGLYSHKIYSGFYSALFLLLSFLLLGGRLRIFYMASFFLSVLLSGSSLAIATLAILVFFYCFGSILLNRNKRYFDIGILFSFTFLVILFLIVLYPNLVQLLGRDATFTGRSTLWNYGIEFFLEKSVFGWGYSGIFSDSNFAPSNFINDFHYYQAPHFHNSYIQILAELGAIGFLGFLVFMVFLFRSITKSEQSGKMRLSGFVIVCTLITVGFFMLLFYRYNEFSLFLVCLVFMVFHDDKIYRFS